MLDDQPFAQPIDFVYFDLWHYYGRTAKHGAFMGGAGLRPVARQLPDAPAHRRAQGDGRGAAEESMAKSQVSGTWRPSAAGWRLFVLVNLAFLSLDIYLAHSVNQFRHEAEYIPLYFSLAAPLVLLVATRR